MLKEIFANCKTKHFWNLLSRIDPHGSFRGNKLLQIRCLFMSLTFLDSSMTLLNLLLLRLLVALFEGFVVKQDPKNLVAKIKSRILIFYYMNN